MRRPLVLLTVATAALAWAPAQFAAARRGAAAALPQLRPTTTHRAAPAADAPLPPPTLTTKLVSKVRRAVARPKWRGAAAVTAGAVAASWGLRAPLAALLEKSFLGDAFATLLRAGARRDVFLKFYALAAWVSLLGMSAG